MTNFFLRDENRLLNIAHRGGAAVRPENTLAAFRHALAVGAAALEGDLHATRDGVVVVSHDATVDRTTNGRGRIKDMRFEELRILDAGYRFTRDGGVTHPYRGEGLRIPTLEEVFRDPVLKRTPMVLEIKQEKPDIADAVLDLVLAHEMVDRLVMGSFSRPALEGLRRRAAARGISLVTSLAEEEVFTFFLTPLEEMTRGDYVAPGSLLQVPVDHEVGGKKVEVVGPELMAKARALGLKVQVWTVNDVDRMRWLAFEMGVDGIITDDPGLLTQVIHTPGGASTIFSTDR
jgi:glycerophosphoryl diester phosphodiesterase